MSIRVFQHNTSNRHDGPVHQLANAADHWNRRHMHCRDDCDVAGVHGGGGDSNGAILLEDPVTAC